MTAKDICNALTLRGAVFDSRRWVAIPNVSWGWAMDYEADLIAVSKDMWASEIEIKISASDLRADRQKRKFRNGLDERIKRFWYAVPETLADIAVAEVDARYGVISIVLPPSESGWPRAKVIRRATKLDARKVTPDEIQELLRLGVLRYWDLRLTRGEHDDRV